MFSLGHPTTIRRDLAKHSTHHCAPTLDHFTKLIVQVPIYPTSIVWRCSYCKFEIDSEYFDPTKAREHLAECESEWIDPQICSFFTNELESLQFDASLCRIDPQMLASSVSNSLHSIEIKQ